MPSQRRNFLRRLASFSGIAAAPVAAQTARSAAVGGTPSAVPAYARTMHHQSLKQSSFDKTGGNSDRWPIAPGAMQEVFRSEGPGVVTHIWFTIAAASGMHLKELVLRAYWDGSATPSIEVPMGDFFGLNLGNYVVYQSAFLNCSSVKALNAYFAMPFRRSALLTVTNEGKQPVNSFYSNIDYQRVAELPADALYFHAQYRQSTPNTAVKFAAGEKEINLDGSKNYIFAETRGAGHLMGITMGVLQAGENWWGEGDEMIFIDDETKPAITGTGSEDYICGAWDFGGRDGAVPFAHLYNGAHFMQSPEHGGGRYLMYRWHADNPVTFQRYLKHTIEHGHANDRADHFYSTCYWYQAQPASGFPALPPAEQRIPVLSR